MRAEVGLLSRNIMFRGDPETSSKLEYGAQIMVHSNGMETLTARIEYVHFFDVWIRFLTWKVPHSLPFDWCSSQFIYQGKCNSAVIQQSLHYSWCSLSQITDNVVFNVKGHNFFIEDAAETKNYLENNLAIWTKRSWSLLVSD
jgi:hypothetical protein